MACLPAQDVILQALRLLLQALLLLTHSAIRADLALVGAHRGDRQQPHGSGAGGGKSKVAKASAVPQRKKEIIVPWWGHRAGVGKQQWVASHA